MERRRRVEREDMRAAPECGERRRWRVGEGDAGVGDGRGIERDGMGEECGLFLGKRKGVFVKSSSRRVNRNGGSTYVAKI